MPRAVARPPAALLSLSPPLHLLQTTLNYNSTATGNGCRNNNNPAELIRFDYTDAAGWTASQALYSPTFDSAKDFAYMPNVPADANANVLGVSGQNVGVSYNLYTVDAVSYSPNNAGLGMGGKQTPSLYVYNSQVSPASNLNKMSFQAQTPSPWGGSLTAAGAYYGKAVENTPTGTGVFLGCPAFSAPPPPPPYTPTNSDGTSTIVAPPAAPANPAFASLIAPPPAGTAPRPFTLGNIAGA